MTEHDWLTSADPNALCDFARSEKVPVRTRWSGYAQAPRFAISDRKWRLIDLACLARVTPHLSIPAIGDIVRLVEQFVEGELDITALVRHFTVLSEQVASHLMRPSWLLAGLANRGNLTQIISDWHGGRGLFDLAAAARGNAAAAAAAAEAQQAHEQAVAAEKACQADLVREVLGNIFHTERIDPIWLRADRGLAERLAREAYEARRYDDLPILADALEDAGCSSTALLSHLRSGGPHVLGCWAIDRLLGKE